MVFALGSTLLHTARCMSMHLSSFTVNCSSFVTFDGWCNTPIPIVLSSVSPVHRMLGTSPPGVMTPWISLSGALLMPTLMHLYLFLPHIMVMLPLLPLLHLMLPLLLVNRTCGMWSCCCALSRRRRKSRRW